MSVRVIDWQKFERFLNDGTAEQILTEIGALGAETILEEQGENRTWDQLDKSTRDAAEATMTAWALRRGFRIEADDESCIIYLE